MEAGTNSRCPFYRCVHLIEVSVKRESTVEYRLNMIVWFHESSSIF